MLLKFGGLKKGVDTTHGSAKAQAWMRRARF